jgi:hypothetical protein
VKEPWQKVQDACVTHAIKTYDPMRLWCRVKGQESSDAFHIITCIPCLLACRREAHREGWDGRVKLVSERLKQLGPTDV